MRNLFPLTVQAEVAQDLDAAIASSEKNRDPSGLGWTAMHMITAPSSSYVETNLLATEVAKAVQPIMPRVRHFYATIGGAIGRAERDPWGAYDDEAWSFGFGPHCYLKLDTEGDYVKNIWFDFSSSDPSDVSALRASITAINSLVPSFIGDYFMEAEVPVSDTELLDRYFAHRKTQMEEAEIWMREQRDKRGE